MQRKSLGNIVIGNHRSLHLTAASVRTRTSPPRCPLPDSLLNDGWWLCAETSQPQMQPALLCLSISPESK
jgi:hypothetical protein